MEHFIQNNSRKLSTLLIPSLSTLLNGFESVNPSRTRCWSRVDRERCFRDVSVGEVQSKRDSE